MIYTITPKDKQRHLIEVTKLLILTQNKYPDRKIFVTIEIEGLEE